MTKQESTERQFFATFYDSLSREEFLGCRTCWNVLNVDFKDATRDGEVIDNAIKKTMEFSPERFEHVGKKLLAFALIRAVKNNRNIYVFFDPLHDVVIWDQVCKYAFEEFKTAFFNHLKSRR